MFEKYDESVKRYLSNMECNCLSPDSISSYSRTFRMFRQSMAEHGYSEPCPAAVVDFKISKEGVSLTTIALYLTHLRLLSAFSVQTGILEEGYVPDAVMPPAKKLSARRRKEYEHTLTESQVLALLSAEKPLYGRKPRTWLREKAEVALFLQSGLRNSELRALTPDDLDWENSLIHAKVTKGGKPRFVPFPQPAQEAVRAYLASPLRPAHLDGSQPLFGLVSRATGKWEPMDRDKLSQRILYFTRSVLGEEAACRTHALRHGYASYLLEHEIPVQFISESLGHSSVSTTAIYAKRLTREAPAQRIASLFEASVKSAPCAEKA